ncbi:S-layer homology domain-containing protein [Aquibacillus rhizosphaerae]|uniref:S-layer homology domain-containing protein n=1 Tax=Aquibacillus rhizosphaerae TaxID=3051431 RepID=A0ABT7LAE7_9BACI|nr:S-layer homology domain-containing protein [Aquibacillus sp. LR5S19]MDL4842849.1 S-layer homology domain-containing protein [Aquibacillus sp. LR5S19]
MSLRKKILTTMTVFLCSFLFFSNVSAATFPDVPTWADDEISYLFNSDVTNGYPNGTFGTNDNIKRSEAAVMLVRAKKLDGGSTPAEPMFSDIRKGSFYYEAVQIAAENGFINGFSDGAFRPNETLTRGQMAKIISVAYGLNAKSGNYFSDIPGTFAEKYIEGLAANGITNGYSDGTFKPNSNINRVEFSIMLSRAMNDSFKVKPVDPVQDMKVHFLDVGQGDSTLIITPNGGTILVDAGSSSSGQKIVQYLKSAGIDSIDKLVATHAHEDHIGGMLEVMQNFEIGEVIDSGIEHTSQTYINYLTHIDNNNIPFKVPSIGDKVTIDSEVDITVVNSGEPGDDLNNSSVALHLVYDSFSFLVTGDAEEDKELKMVNNFNIESDVLQVGHHGSITSSSDIFINEVSPSFAIFSYGEGNSYGHPDSRVVNVLRNQGADIYSTAYNGDIVLTTNGNSITFNVNPWATEIIPLPEPNPEPNNSININTADYETLLLIKGVGPSIAENIIDYRNRYGHFRTIEELDNVKYIGPATIEEMRPYITI